jgi:hypothetical protein
MALCINQSGTWRNITTQCVNQTGTWRKVVTGCINQSNTWRCFGFTPPPTVTISVSPTSIVQASGTSSTLTWSSTNATSVTSTTNFSTSSLSGSQTVTPSNTTTYSITVSNATGSASASATLTVTIPALGSSFQGGTLICRSGGVNWIVGPYETSVSWNSLPSVVDNTTTITGCSGWFIPSCGQLQNPGYTCRTYWSMKVGPYLGYWSSTGSPFQGQCAYALQTSSGLMASRHKPQTCCVRAFRCVTY